jgi:hypothetical protein
MSGPDHQPAEPRPVRLARARLWLQLLLLLGPLSRLPGESTEGGIVDTHHTDGRNADARHTDHRHEDVRDEVRRDGVIRPAYAFAARNLIRLLGPALRVFLPIGLLAASALAVLVDGSAAVVNGDVELVGTPGTPLLVWSAAVLAVSVAGQAVAVSATVVLVTGLLVGRPVSTSGAMRAALRRWPALALLVLVGVLAFAAAMVAWSGVLVWLDAEVMVFAVPAAALFVMPCLLAVPGVVLEGRSAMGALARAYRLTGGGARVIPFTLAFGVVIYPALVPRAASWAVSGLPIAPVAAGMALALAAVPFQAAVITRMFLRRLVIKGSIAEFEEIADRHPPSPPRPARPLPVLAALLLPGLVYGGAVLINPAGWIEVAETAVTEGWSRDQDSETFEEDGRPKPGLDTTDLRALYAGPGGRMVMLMDDSAAAKLLTCLDSGCARTRLSWAEPVGVAGGFTATGARLADGRLVVSTWGQEGVYEDGLVRDEEKWPIRLGLLICDEKGCLRAPDGKPVTEVTSFGEPGAVALAARPGGGLLVARLHELPSDESDDDTEALTITICDDPACARPRTKEVARLPGDRYANDEPGLIASVGPDDRLVALRFDRDTGSISVIACADPACARARVGRPVREGFGDRARGAGAAMVLRADGRPLIAYRDVTDGAIKLLDCHTRECPEADTATLSEPGRNAGPVMVLDRSGRALVAYQDLDRDRIVLATCTRTRCSGTPVTTIRRGGGDGLAMALDGHGRPTLAWMDVADHNDWDLVVTTPLNLP